MKSLVKYFWLLLFLYPFLNLFTYLVQAEPLRHSVDLLQVLRVTGTAILQALASSILISSVGLFLGLSLIGANSKGILKLLLVLPAFAPNIFLMTSVIAWGSKFGITVRPGFLTVVLLHFLMNVGFAGVLFARLFELRAIHLWRLPFIEGASRRSVFYQTVKNLRKDIFIVSSGFFAFCFTSFSVPLLLGGRSGQTLEILVFEQLAFKGDITGALTIALWQMLLFAMGLRWISSQSARPEVPPPYLEKDQIVQRFRIPNLAALAAPLLFVISFSGMFLDFIEGLYLLGEQPEVVSLLRTLTAVSLALSLVAAGLGMFFFLILLYFSDIVALPNMLLRFGAVSTALLGISIFILDGDLLAKLLYGFLLLNLPIAYRMVGAEFFDRLGGQRILMQTLGASRWVSFKNVVFPQAVPVVLRLGGLIAVWSLGDFALTSVITGEAKTLAVLLRILLGSYRLEVAAALGVLLLCLVAVVYLIFESLSYVSHKKLVG